jgi:sarcosine oxidase
MTGMAGADAIVVGLGAMGSAALYQLAKRGVRALGIDRFSPPHEHGSSHGDTRITRQAIGEGESYVPIVLRAHEIWREIERETGQRLLDQCGGLVLAGRTGVHPKKAAFVQQTIAAAERYGIEHEVLNADEIAHRFPQFVLDGDETGYFEPGAGYVYPERCIAAQLDLASRHGATIRTGEIVTGIVPRASGVRVETDKGSYEAERVILSAGAWSPGLAGGPLDRMALHRQVLTWFEPDSPADFEPGRFPVFIWLHGRVGEHSYGFPIPPGTRGLKVATELYEHRLGSPAEIDRTVTDAEIATIYGQQVAGLLRGVSSRCLAAKTCFYTQAPDGAFVIDHHPESERVMLVSACSGHGFKHSAAIGEALAGWATEGRAALDLSPFGLARWAAAA